MPEELGEIHPLGMILGYLKWGFPARHGATPKIVGFRTISQSKKDDENRGTPMTKRKPPYQEYY